MKARTGAVLAGLAGLSGFVVLVAYQHFPTLGGLLATAGWGIAAVVVVHIPPMMVSAVSWRLVARPLYAGKWRLFLWARIVRESVGGVLPVTQIGGDVAGARVLAFHGMRANVAGASVVVDLTLEFLTQIVFTLLGLGLLLRIDGSGKLLSWSLLGVTAAVLAAAGLLAAQRWGIFRLFERLMEQIAFRFEWPAAGALANLHDTVGQLYRDRRAVAGATACHMLAWLIGAGETWLILHILGADIGIAGVLVIESLGQAVRTAAFFVPGALGVQEGGFLLLGTMFGLPPEVGLTVSLIKRVREITLGVPAVLAWQAIEGRRLLRPADPQSGA